MSPITPINPMLFLDQHSKNQSHKPAKRQPFKPKQTPSKRKEEDKGYWVDIEA